MPINPPGTIARKVNPVQRAASICDAWHEDNEAISDRSHKSNNPTKNHFLAKTSPGDQRTAIHPDLWHSYSSNRLSRVTVT